MHRPLPVTLIGGFLGAGKTSLLHHLVTEHRGGHLALLIGTPGALNPDAKAIRGLCGAMRRNHDAVEEIPAGDEQAQLKAVASRLRQFAEAGSYERVLIEVDGITNASRWMTRLAELNSGGSGLPIEVNSVICVVDLLDFHHNFATPGSPISPALRDFQRAQMQVASALVLNKCDLAGDAERQQATRLLRSINPEAKVIETAYGEVPPEIIFTAAPSRSGSARIVNQDGADDPGALESVIYRAHRPFHPGRFWEWFNADHPGVLRVKGLVWLATRNLLVGGVSRTALQNSCGAAGIWWAALPREEWPSDPAILTEMQNDWREPYGDRRQELLLIGENGPTGTAARHLNNCLLRDDEYARPPSEWVSLPDPFPVWDLEA